MDEFLLVCKEKCVMEGPFECPYCAGNVMFDWEVLERGIDRVFCPYCNREALIPGRIGGL